jgi:DNA-directed RNA polymerase
VNLAAGEKPGDVYSHVAGMVERQVNSDASKTDSEFHKVALRL